MRRKKILFALHQAAVPVVSLKYNPPTSPILNTQIRQEKSAAELLRQSWNTDTLQLLEEFKVLLLNTNHRVLGILTVAQGGFDKIYVDPKIILAAALLSGASRIIIAHNHPSGCLQPSSSDKVTTQKIKEGAALLDMILLDHIILTADSYYSFADEGLL